MGHCYHHALSSVRKWGGEPEDYLPLHQWFDEPSKLITADFRHRALRHHAEGVFMLERFFGATINNCPKLIGSTLLFCALAGPIVVLTGGLMFVVHKPHTAVAGNATLYAVQNDDFFNIVMPDTYSWCVYALRAA